MGPVRDPLLGRDSVIHEVEETGIRICSSQMAMTALLQWYGTLDRNVNGFDYEIYVYTTSETSKFPKILT